MTTYLVTGASGFLGGELVGRLLARDDAGCTRWSGPRRRRAWPRSSGSGPAAGDVEPELGDLAQPLLGLTPAASSA